ncbi:hypothetical protein SAY87_007385 [Trapa incisa]|uniref:Uncharacterized protein n=1 Tax=Trapa incisa TaxID=236973 RepID=A0AAN7JXS9_9MYRT|nr:hypothetical protein SAY87_007385 [Trapa incisa]
MEEIKQAKQAEKKAALPRASTLRRGSKAQPRCSLWPIRLYLLRAGLPPPLSCFPAVLHIGASSALEGWSSVHDVLTCCNTSCLTGIDLRASSVPPALMLITSRARLRLRGSSIWSGRRLSRSSLRRIVKMGL